MNFFKRHNPTEALPLTPPPLPKEVPSVSQHNRNKNSTKNNQPKNEQSSSLATFIEKNRMAPETILQADQKITTLYKAVLNETIPTTAEGRETLRAALIDIMSDVKTFSESCAESENECLGKYEVINERFQELLTLKNKTADELRSVFDEVFQKFGDFIDNEIVLERMSEIYNSGNTIYIEQITQEVYGRSRQEIEKIKERNRKEVVEAIQEMAKEDEITPEMIIELHRINNKDIVPRLFSQFRKNRIEAGFGVRIGTLAEDVDFEMDDLIDRANKLIERKDTLNKILYGINAARLHNIMLDMHPFADRNGSTSLLFLELLMAKAGYKPTPERPTEGYYKFLTEVLQNNFTAIATVAYEQYLIAKVPGYYAGQTSRIEERREQYQEALKRGKEIRLRRKQEKHDLEKINTLRAQIASTPEEEDDDKIAA